MQIEIVNPEIISTENYTPVIPLNLYVNHDDRTVVITGSHAAFKITLPTE